MLVLEPQLQHRAALLARSLDPRLAACEAGFGSARDVGDLAREDAEPTQPLDDCADRVAVRRPRLSHQPPELLGEADRPRHHRLFQHPPVHAVERDHRRAAHVDRERAGEPFRPAVVDRFDDRRVALLVGERHRRGRDAVHRRGDHLDLREGAAHAVGVDQRDAHRRRDAERCRRVEPARLDRDGVRDRPADEVLQRLEGADDLVAARELLDHHRGRTHHRRGHDDRVVGDLLDVDELDRAVLPDRLLREQRADVRVAAAPGAENRRADREVVEVVFTDQAQRTPSPARARRPP